MSFAPAEDSLSVLLIRDVLELFKENGMCPARSRPKDVSTPEQCGALKETGLIEYCVGGYIVFTERCAIQALIL